MAKVVLKLSDQELFLNLLLESKTCAADVAAGDVTQELFDEQWRPLVKLVVETWKKSKRLVSPDAYRTHLLKMGVKGNLSAAMDGFYDCQHGAPLNNTEEQYPALLERLQKAYIWRKGAAGVSTWNDTMKAPDGDWRKATQEHAANALELAAFGTGGRGRVLVTPFANVDELEVEDWIWDNRISAGEINVLSGDPGVGKSFLTVELAAHISTGKPWCDGAECERGDVLIISTEHNRKKQRKRLAAHGADLSRVNILDAVDHGDGQPPAPFCMETDWAFMERFLSEHKYRMIIIDPVGGQLTSSTRSDSHRDNDVRRILAPYATIAEQHNAAFLLVCHLNKNSKTSSIYRTMGSIGFEAAARNSWRVENDGDKKLLKQVKSNDAPPTWGIEFQINDDGVIEWGAYVAPMLDTEPLGAAKKTQEAVEFLKEALSDGAVLANHIYEQAENLGIKRRTLDGAKPLVPVYSKRRKGAWFWSLTELDEEQG